MNGKEWMALALTLALSGATLTPAVYAETTATEATVYAETAATEAAAETADQTEKTKEEKPGQKEQKSKKNKSNKKKKDKKQRIDEPENAIGKEASVEKALADAGVTAEQAGKVRSRVSQLDDGTIVYKVKFTCDGLKYSCLINAVSGEVVEKSSEAATENADKSKKHTATEKTAGQEKVTENSTSSDEAADQKNSSDS